MSIRLPTGSCPPFAVCLQAVLHRCPPQGENAGDRVGYPRRSPSSEAEEPGLATNTHPRRGPTRLQNRQVLLSAKCGRRTSLARTSAPGSPPSASERRSGSSQMRPDGPTSTTATSACVPTLLARRLNCDRVQRTHLTSRGSRIAGRLTCRRQLARSGAGRRDAGDWTGEPGQGGGSLGARRQMQWFQRDGVRLCCDRNSATRHSGALSKSTETQTPCKGRASQAWYFWCRR